MEIFDILGPNSQHPVAIEVKFCIAEWTHLPVGPAKFDANWYNKSPLQGEKPDFFGLWVNLIPAISINQSIHGICKAPLTELDSGAAQKYGKKYDKIKQEAQLMLTTGSTRLAFSRGQQT